MSEIGSLSGKVAVITGGTQGLGAAIAREFLYEGVAGLIICGRTAQRGEILAAEFSSGGVPVHFVKADLGSVEDCRKVIECAEHEFGRLDALVNAAGLSTRGTLLSTSEALYDQLYAVNSRAPFFLMQSAARVMRRNAVRGTIVNIISVASHGGPPDLIAYSGSKASLSLLTRSAAYSLLPDGIRVNGLNIGWTRTDGEDAVQQALGKGADWLERAVTALPAGRLIEPSEVARMVVLLSSDRSGLMTGSIIDFDQIVHGCRTSNPTPPPLEDVQQKPAL